MARNRLCYLYSSLRKRFIKKPNKHPAFPFSEEEFLEKGIRALRAGKCPYCGDVLTLANISPDHIYPLQLGGSWKLKNINFVCIDCNIEKSWTPVFTYLGTKPSTRIGQRYTAKMKRLREEKKKRSAA